MYSFIRFTACLLLAALLMPAPGGRDAAAMDIDSEFLEVTSGGYWRFEIEDGNVVAFFTGGVEFSYLGYKMQSDELRYNQATEAAEVTGQVVLTLDDGTVIQTDYIVLDGSAGTGVIPGLINGSLQDNSVTFSAGSATLSFPPGEVISSEEQISFTLHGGVSVLTADGYTVSTAEVTYDGATRRVVAPGQVAVVAQGSDGSGLGGMAGTWFAVNGGNMIAELDGTSGFSFVEMASINAEFTDGWLSAGSARFEPYGPEVDGKHHAWLIRLANGPVSGQLVRGDASYEVEAESIEGIMDRAGVSSMTLTGPSRVASESMELVSDEIVITRQADTYIIDAPDVTEARFDFAQLSGAEPLSIDTIKSWLD